MNASFLLQLSKIHFKFPLWAITHLDEKVANIMGQTCPIQALSIRKVHAAEHVTQFGSVSWISSFEVWSLNETYKATGSVSAIKMEEPTTSTFI